MSERMPSVLLGVSGSIAAYKAVEVARLLGKAGVRVQVAMTRGGTEFVRPLTFAAITGREVLTDVFQVASPGGGAEIGHVERAHQVDLVLVAPASANVMARMVAGMADDPLTATILSTRAPVMIAPAMESGMWMHPATQDNLACLEERGVKVVGPVTGELASGRAGMGRMAEPDVIVRAALAILRPGDLTGLGITITAGPTWEPLDPVRILTNRSTGAMGIAIAQAAQRRGAQVRLILGPTHLTPPPGVDVRRVETAAEMLAAAQAVLPGTDVFVATAAVSDFRPQQARDQKLKRSAPEAQTLALAENPDVLATISSALRARGAARPATVVGFAAETEAVEDNARDKLVRKGCDLVIGNLVGPEAGFGAGQTRVLAVARDRPAVAFGPALKGDVAEFVLDQVLRVRDGSTPEERGA
ncbi:MAG: bifunctional phosphopantothenoylcysteine decarboxylase/phosphopantothenate--cysteine ligase CoaBC [Deltaproteobacteria bacterium]|nr:bifunctional phosphopantothenoylcysteine decarboxylase/phosphopantothenate--cysteine ligase CoaBC [Deltaproteobacteria bacterium]